MNRPRNPHAALNYNTPTDPALTACLALVATWDATTDDELRLQAAAAEDDFPDEPIAARCRAVIVARDALVAEGWR